MMVTEKMAREACEALGWGAETLDGELTPEGVNAQYRTAAKAAHPDAGGSDVAFAAVDRAKHVLLAWLARPAAKVTPGAGEVCGRCDGKGFVTTYFAFRQGRMQCPTCRGTGDMDSEHEKTDTGVNK